MEWLLLIAIFLPQYAFCICFPEKNEERCSRCSADYYVPGSLFTDKNQYFPKALCKKKNSSGIVIRNILVGVADDHANCLNENSSRCSDFNSFLEKFDGYYENILFAFAEENIKINEYLNSSINFHVFGELDMFHQHSMPGEIEYFRRAFSKIFVKHLNCIDYKNPDICLAYSKKQPVLLINKNNVPKLYVAALLYITNIKIRFISSEDFGRETLQVFINLEPIIDLKPCTLPAVKIFNVSIEDYSNDLKQIFFLLVSKLGGSISLETIEIVNWNLGNFIKVWDEIESFYSEYYDGFMSMIETKNNSLIAISNILFNNNDSTIINYAYFSLKNYNGTVIFSNLSIFNTAMRKYSNILFEFENIENEVSLINVTLINGSFNTILFCLGTEIFVSQFYLKNISFYNGSLVTISDCNKSEVIQMEMVNANIEDLYSKVAVISVIRCKEFSLRKSLFYLIYGFFVEALSSLFIVDMTNFNRLIYNEFMFSCNQANCSYHNSLFYELQGFGVILQQFKQDLILINNHFSFIEAIVIINFDKLRKNILINCTISFMDNPLYVWGRNLEVINQTVINTTFSNSKFVRIQSFYGLFDFHPLVIYNECTFANLTFEIYGFDYCWLDVMITDTLYINIQMLSDSINLFSFESDGNYAIADSKFNDVGWLVYESGGAISSNQALIDLWYPNSLIISNSSFLCSKDSLSLRSGFLTSIDLKHTIIIESCSFIVQNPSPFFPIKAVILYSILRVEIKNCIFINLTGDFINQDFTHMNGVITIIGSLSLIERKANSFSVLFYNVTIKNVKAINGAAITVVNYKNIEINDCYFHNGTAEGGMGGLIAVIFAQNLTITLTRFSKGLAAIGGHVYLKNVELGQIFSCNFSESEAAEVGGIFSIVESKVSLIKVEFGSSKCSGNGGIIFQQLGKILIKMAKSYNIETIYDGGGFSLENIDSFEIYDSNFEKMKAGGKGGLVFGEVQFVNINNFNMTNLQNFNDGTLLFIENFEKMYVVDVKLLSLKCERYCRKGLMALMTVIPDSFVIIQNLILNQSISVEGSLLQIISDTKINIKHSLIINYQGGNLFSLEGISAIEISVYNLSFSFCKLRDQVLFYLKKTEFSSSHLDITDIEMRQNIFVIIQSSTIIEVLKIGFNSANLNFKSPFPCLFSIDSSIVSIRSLVFDLLEKLKFVAFPTIFDVLESVLNFEDFRGEYKFENLLLKSKDSNISFKSLEIHDESISNSQKVLNSFSSKTVNCLYIEKCSFKIWLGTCIQTNEIPNIIIKNSFFVGDSNWNITRAFYIKKAINLWISASFFSNFNSAQGACIFIEDFINLKKTKINISESYFKKMSGESGSAFYINSNFDISVKECLFEGNLVYSVYNSRASGIGGALFFDCLLINTEENRKCVIELKSNKFINNTADHYGNDFFSNCDVLMEDNEFILSDISTNIMNYISYPLNVSFFKNEKSTNSINVESGTPENFTISLSDNFGHIITYDSISNARIQVISEQQSKGIQLQNSIAFCKKGIFHFNELIVRGPTNLQLNLTLHIDFLSDPINPLVKLQFDLPIFIKNCEEGHMIELDNTCRKCDKGTYSFVEPSKKSYCKKCMPDFECKGGNEVFPLPGYWRQSKHALLAIECIIPDSCLGGNKQNMTVFDLEHGACLEGHQGNLCFDCTKGFGKQKSQSICKECKNQTSILIVRTVGILVALVLFILINTFLLSRIKKKPQVPQKSMNFVFLQIIFSHLQTISIITFMEDLSSIPKLTEAVNIQSYFSLVNDDFFSFDCILDQDSQTATLYKKIGIVLLPLFVSTICLVGWLFLAIIYYIKSRSQFTRPSVIYRQLFVSFSFGAYLLYPMILQSAFSIPNCIEFNDGITTPRHFLFINPDIECWNSFHLKFIFFIFIPSFVLWGILFPLLLIKVFKLGRRKLEKIQESPQKSPRRGSFSDILSTIEYKAFSFFYENYNDQHYYWEILIFFKKFFLTGLAGIRNIIGVNMKLILLDVVIIIYTVILIRIQPFRSKKYNIFELASGIIIIFFLLVISVLKNENSSNNIVFGYITLLINGLFIFLLTFEGIKQFIKRNKQIFTKNYWPSINSLFKRKKFIKEGRKIVIKPKIKLDFNK